MFDVTSSALDDVVGRRDSYPLCYSVFINSLILQIFECLSLLGTVWYFCSRFSFKSQFYAVPKSHLSPFQPVCTLS